jgi:hypothetical protein
MARGGESPDKEAKSDSRIWTDATTGRQLLADFIKRTGDSVKLLKVDDQIVNVPLNRLSKEDQEWVVERVRKVREHVALPKPEEDKTSLRPVDMTKLKIAEGDLFRIEKDGEVNVDGRLVKRLSIPQPGQGGELVVLMKNRTDHSLTPHIEIHIYDPYAVLVGEYHVIWALDSVLKDTTHSDNARGSVYDIRPYLRYSSLVLPADVGVPTYVVVIDHSR